MKKLLTMLDAYAAQTTWVDLALLKLCCFGLGLLIGARLPGKHRLAAALAGGGLFVLTVLPLAFGFIPFARYYLAGGHKEMA